MALFPIVTTHLIKNFDEDREQGIDLRFADNIGLLVDIEENAL